MRQVAHQHQGALRFTQAFPPDPGIVEGCEPVCLSDIPRGRQGSGKCLGRLPGPELAAVQDLMNFEAERAQVPRDAADLLDAPVRERPCRIFLFGLRLGVLHKIQYHEFHLSVNLLHPLFEHGPQAFEVVMLLSGKDLENLFTTLIRQGALHSDIQIVSVGLERHEEVQDVRDLLPL